MQNAAGHQAQDKLAVANQNGMAGVVAALVADHVVEVAGKQVNQLALAFVAPLRAQNNQIAHCC